MSKKIAQHAIGDCVEVSTWMHETDGFFHPNRAIGLVLEAELVEMDMDDIDNPSHDDEEWLYRVSLPDGRVTEVWDYEIKPVNAMGKEYNNISHQPEGD